MLVPRDRHKMKQKWNWFRKEINSFMLNVTDWSAISPATSEGAFLLSWKLYVIMFMSHESEAQSVSAHYNKKVGKHFSIPRVPFPFAPLSSPGWRVWRHLCWDNLLEYPDFPNLIYLKEINGHYCGQIHPKPELSLFGIPTNRAHPKRNSAKSNYRLNNYYPKGHEA